ncbi:MAG TPA: hypothetical protein DCM87_13765 [Planctomycetes bacterium]|nr:hypothetical protein [Planctomycetota bacterium]
MDLVFEWDEPKAKGNETKHGVSFEEGKTVFNDPFAITIPDPAHSSKEARWLDIGLSARGRVLVVWYTERQEHIRIIGCRRATRGEQRAYEHERTS